MFCTHSLIGQNKLTNAIYSLKNKELDKAKELIDAASVDSMFSKRAATWYYKGFIYKDLFKRDEANIKTSPLREKAVEFFLKSYEMGPNSTFAKGSSQGIKFLAQTYYNQSAISFNPTDYPLALSSYEKYKALVSRVDTTADFKEKDLNFNLAMASTYGRIASIDSTKSKLFLDKAKEIYEEVLAIDPNNITANYNLGILYYNEGVEIVNTMDYGLDLVELTILQDQIVEMFRTSLPYMKRAYDLNPTRKETLIGLQGIYFSLNDIPKSEAFKKQIDELNGSDSTKQDPNSTIEQPTKE